MHKQKTPTEYLKLGGGKPDRLPGLSYQKDCDLSLFFLFIYFFIFLKTEQADFLCKDLHQIAVIRSSSKQKEQRLNRIRKVCKGESGKIVGINFLSQREL